MSSYDRKQFFQAMQHDGYISKLCDITNNGEVKAPAHIERNALNESKEEFNQALQKLFGQGWKLTKEQEDYIINLSKRF
jgi:superoxide dismutase